MGGGGGGGEGTLQEQTMEYLATLPSGSRANLRERDRELEKSCREGGYKVSCGIIAEDTRGPVLYFLCFTGGPYNCTGCMIQRTNSRAERSETGKKERKRGRQKGERKEEGGMKRDPEEMSWKL